MKHARRLGAAAVASSVSLLATVGLAEAITAADDADTAPAPATTGVAERRDPGGSKGPTRLIVIRRSRDATEVSGGTVYVQAPSTAGVAVATAPAPAPATATTRSS